MYYLNSNQIFIAVIPHTGANLYFPCAVHAKYLDKLIHKTLLVVVTIITISINTYRCYLCVYITYTEYIPYNAWLYITHCIHPCPPLLYYQCSCVVVVVGEHRQLRVKASTPTTRMCRSGTERKRIVWPQNSHRIFFAIKLAPKTKNTAIPDELPVLSLSKTLCIYRCWYHY